MNDLNETNYQLKIIKLNHKNLMKIWNKGIKTFIRNAKFAIKILSI